MVLTNPFSVEIPFDENRVGEFISFFSSISDQMFSKSLDRAKFGEYTLLLKTLDSISICYLFKGHSYTAQLRLKKFFESIKKDTNIMESLNTAIQAGKFISIEENPELKTMIEENFLSDPKKFQVSTEMDEELMLQNHTLLTPQTIEEKVTIHTEKKICTICKGEVIGLIYMCECETLYCEKSMKALVDLENACWVCQAPIDQSRPIKPFKKEEGEIKDKILRKETKTSKEDVKNSKGT